MLPNTTPITRDEQATIISLGIDILESLTERRPRVVLLPANTSCDLFFIYGLFISIGGLFGSLDLFGQVRALAASWWLGDVFAGKGVWCSGFLVVI